MNNRIDTDAISAMLTAPGAPFEMATREIGGVPCRVFKNCPSVLPQLYQQAERFADRVMTVENGKRHTFRDVFKKAARLAENLKINLGVDKGQRIAIVMQNSTEWMIAFIAVTSLGAVAVLVNSRGAPIELDRAILDTDCGLVIADAARAKRLDETDGASRNLARVVRSADASALRTGRDHSFDALLDGWEAAGKLDSVAVDGEDPAIMMFTSGSTGFPKGTILTQRSVMVGLSGTAFSSAVSFAKFTARLGAEAAKQIASAQPVSLLVAPLFHVSGCHSVFLNALATGSKIAVLNRWNADEALKLIAEERIQSIACVPTMLWDMLRSPDFGKHDLSSLAVIGAGGAPFPPNLIREVSRVLPRVVFVAGYGLTETSGPFAVSSGEDFLAQPDSVGKIMPLADVKLVDDDGREVATGRRGEILVRGAMLMNGYFGHAADSAATLKDGWVSTGDIGRFDERGLLYIVGRKKLMIISGGENIYCAEVEHALSEHPGVREVLAVGVPDSRLGEKLVAVIVPQPGHSLDAEELRTHAAKHLAAYKMPHAFYFRSDLLPRTHTDKIDRVSVTKEVCDDHRDATEAGN